ncbi:probable E3 ubiquitin-protein ligase BAH1-like [Mercurialis annua]|uniref:probable E3 ubiquitin-protein ligase BAH1-like n=1 Tax=Mercurialis annua TaxID=3986 RepID=UPI00215DDE29|nr:probable E3 ubiquitin-protein ligase BAH1-like [Mercurialis annua]
MKFGETFMEYLHGDQEWFLDKCSHVEYKRLKKVLKNCSICQNFNNHNDNDHQNDDDNNDSRKTNDENSSTLSQSCQCQSCPVCDQKFFNELMKEASDIAGCFSSRVRHLLQLHVAKGMQRYALKLRHCFRNDQQAMIEEGRMLIDYVTMNSIAIRKILKKYDKIHSSVNGKKFKSKLRAEHMELLQSPWLIELGAFYLNCNGLDGGETCGHFSCDLDPTEPIMTLMLPNSSKLDYSLTCAVCLETVFNPCALGCGHLFCKSCACSAASVLILESLKTASPDAKCPVCREAGVYANSVHMLELDLLLKSRCKEYWKERMVAERAEIVKQTKEYWDQQTKYAIGY